MVKISSNYRVSIYKYFRTWKSWWREWIVHRNGPWL